MLLLLLKFICSCTCTRTIAGQQQHETVTATTTTETNLHKLLKRAHISYTTGKCEHFIWKAHSPLYTLSDVWGGISYLSVHFIWQVDLAVHFIWKQPNSALCHKMSLLGGISDLSVHFIWQVYLVVHFIWKLDLILQPFWMGSHWRHRSATTWSPVTDSLKWGVYLISACTSSDKLTISNGLSLKT